MKIFHLFVDCWYIVLRLIDETWTAYLFFTFKSYFEKNRKSSALAKILISDKNKKFYKIRYFFLHKKVTGGVLLKSIFLSQNLKNTTFLIKFDRTRLKFIVYILKKNLDRNDIIYYSIVIFFIKDGKKYLIFMWRSNHVAIQLVL